MTSRLILLRHAETHNVAQVWQGSLDAPFSPKGQAQVDATAHNFPQFVQKFPVDRTYVSPTGRAQRTAHPFGKGAWHPSDCA